MSSVVLPDKLTAWSWKDYVDTNCELTTEQFVRLASASSGWKLISSGNRPYNLRNEFQNLDEYVKEALWNFDEQLYDSVRGWTKTPRLGGAMRAHLLRYCGKVVYKSRLFDKKMTVIYNANLCEIKNRFKRIDVRSSLRAAASKIPWNTSAGYLYPGKKKGEIIELAVKDAESIVDQIKHGKWPEHRPYKLALRGHMSKIDERKSRVVWVSDTATNILEQYIFGEFYEQLFDRTGLGDTVLSGKDALPRLLEFVEGGALPDVERTYLNSDVKAWDSLRCRFVLKDVLFGVLKPNINFQDKWQEKLFEWLVEDFIYSQLALPDGTILQKTSGVPSGSFLTLIMNSLCNFLIQTSCFRYLGVSYSEPKVLGDDFASYLAKMSDPAMEKFKTEMANCVFRFFHIVMSPEKQVLTNLKSERKFIGYQLKQGRLYRDSSEWFRMAIYTEGPVPDLKTSFTRMFAFFVIGGCNDVKFTKFYDYFFSGYYKELQKYGGNVFDAESALSGSLRVFKHVLLVDIGAFAELTIEDFRCVSRAKAPYFLTMSMRHLFIYI